jgi:hypothetical protein
MGIHAKVDFEAFRSGRSAAIPTSAKGAYVLTLNEQSYASRRFFESFKCL